jgi:hypothetical protein
LQINRSAPAKRSTAMSNEVLSEKQARTLHPERPSFLKRIGNWLQPPISYFLYSMVRFLNKWDRNLTHYHFNPNPKFYEDLAPSKDIGDEQVYTQAIMWALRNEEITNIALTGPYGSGKSSILKAFEIQNKQYRYLNISLATFDDNLAKGDEQRKLVETSILQQIFYHVKDRQIPDSRFKRIKSLTRVQQVFISIAFTIWLIAGVYTFKPEFFSKFEWLNKFEEANKSQINTICSILFLIGFALGVFVLFRTFRNKKFTKLNLTSGELELAQEESSSILNKYLDEILYFFESTSFNVVIIEDLDRFNDPEIFTKLREINILINNSRQINRRVVFIYAVRDDMFIDKSRTKFFEFIIPVIPVINSSNSTDILIQKLSGARLDKAISNEFISDITLYIDDMRMLKNVINEYIIYKDKIGAGLNQDKLLGMIIYKNLYPRDFADLNENKGRVFGILQKKETYVKSLVASLDQHISEKETLLAGVDALALDSIAELRSVYLLAVLEKFPQDIHSISIGTAAGRHAVKELKEDAYFPKVTETTNFQYLRYGSLYNSGFSFKQIEAEVNPYHTYTEREQLVRRKAEVEKNKLKAEIENMKAQRLLIRECGLSEILQQSPDLVSSIKEDKLLVYLLRYGYIDEHYSSYISYFYEGTITKEDNDFILSVKNHESKPFNFKLTKTGQLIKKLRLHEFDQTEILNYYLLDYLLANSSEYANHLHQIIGQIISKRQDAISFLDGYVSEGSHTDKLILFLVKDWPSFWDFIEQESGYPDKKKEKYLALIISCASVQDIIALNKNATLSTYISKDQYFLNLFPAQEWKKIADVISNLNIKFEDLHVAESAMPLFDFVYQHNHYRINERMVELILEMKGPGNFIDLSELSRCNYTTIQKSGCSHLINYIDENIVTYINELYLKLTDNTYESEESLIALLNKPEVTEDLYEPLLSGQQVQIADIEELETKSWKALMTTSRLKPTWPNILIYYIEEKEIKDPLTGYLNMEGNYTVLAKEPWTTTGIITQELIDEFRYELITCNEISEMAYQDLLSSFNTSYKSPNIKGLSGKKINTLLAQKKLELTIENFDSLKASFAPMHIELIEGEISLFIEHINEYALDATDYDLLLSISKLTREQAQTIIDTIDDGLVNGNSNLPDSLLRVGQMGIRLSSVLLDNLFPLLSTTARIKLLTAQISNLTSEEISNYLGLIGQPYSVIATNARPLLDDNDMNKKLLNALENRGFISSWNYYENRIRVYTRNR